MLMYALLVPMTPVAGKGGGAAPAARGKPRRPRSTTGAVRGVSAMVVAGAAAKGGGGPTGAWKTGTVGAPWICAVAGAATSQPKRPTSSSAATARAPSPTIRGILV